MRLSWPLAFASAHWAICRASSAETSGPPSLIDYPSVDLQVLAMTLTERSLAVFDGLDDLDVVGLAAVGGPTDLVGDVEGAHADTPPLKPPAAAGLWVCKDTE